MGWTPSKFGGDGHCGGGDIMIGDFHVILQNHMNQGLCDFMNRSPSK